MDITDRRGFSNTANCEFLPKKTNGLAIYISVHLTIHKWYLPT